VLPGSDENPVNLGRPGTIPVAILGDADFDAAKVDATTVRLAGAPVATTPEGRLIGFPEDVDGDGVQDLVLHFDVPSLALVAGDTRADLVALTCAGAAFAGSDAVRTFREMETPRAEPPAAHDVTRATLESRSTSGGTRDRS
jgi:hypothetical protein